MPHRRRRDRVTARSFGLIGRRRHAATGAASDTAANVRSAAVAMLVAFGMFALFASDGMRSFSRDLPGNRATDLLVAGADRWHALMLQLGPAHVGPAIREAFSLLRSAEWPGRGVGADGAQPPRI